MKQQFAFTCLACQTCQAKTHCEKCGEDVRQALLRTDGVDRVEINMTAGILLMDGSADADDLENRLEDLGLLIS